MNIAITGAGGGIGGMLWHRFDAEKHRLFHISTKEGPGRYSYDKLYGLVSNEKLDVIIHLAWSSIPADEAGGAENGGGHDVALVKGMLKNLRDSIRKGTPKPLLIFLSSCAIYGEGDGRTEFTEMDSTFPISHYGRKKRVVEELIGHAVSDFGLSALVLRLTNPYGFVRRDHRPQGVISHVIDSVVNDKTFTIWGDGSAIKDFVHIDDVTNAICLLAECRGVGTFNLGSGRSISVIEVIEIVERVFGKRLNTRFAEAPSWDVAAGRYSSKKIAKAFGWSAQIPLELGIMRFCENY